MIGLSAYCLGALLHLSLPGLVASAAPIDPVGADQTGVSVSGELQQWHKVTLTLDGPQASEDGEPNPFLDYRLQVTFRHPATGLTYSVPGYYAADGDAANSSATSGNKWRAHLAPDHEGEWTYSVSFRQGPSVAISDAEDEGTPVEKVDGLQGSFQVAKTDKLSPDFRSKGRLNYVGKHHLQFAGTGEFFLKAGVDAPENLLAYEDFDGDFKTDGKKDNLIKNWAPHVQDWKAGDPTWQDGKGKGLIGAINYLASEGLNAFSFLTLNINGDDCNAFPYTDYDERERMDCSRMDQWETVFAHGTNLGMHLHFKTQECENVHLLDGGHMGPERKLYYRELIARFSHHLAMNWNLGEEVGLNSDPTTQDKIDWAEYFWTHDPYQHPIVIHNGDNHYEMLGEASKLTGFSLQTNKADFSRVHNATLDYINRSAKSGKPWVVACDEPGDASHSLVPDDEDPTRDNARKNALWGNIMAGGAGVEWYFGYKHAHSDLTCQDYRVRGTMWKPCRIALEFFTTHKIPFWNMTNADDLVANQEAYGLADSGKLYLVYSKRGKQIKLNLAGTEGVFQIQWFNPRTGGPLQFGSAQAVRGGGMVSIGDPPGNDGQDWLAILRPGDSARDYPPAVSAGANLSIMMPQSSDSVAVKLSGEVSDDKTNAASLDSLWTKTSGPGTVTFADASSATTTVKLGKVGTYVLKLTASDGAGESASTVTITVDPFQAKVTRAISPIDDAYVEDANVFSNQHLKVEGKRRSAFIKFNIDGLPANLIDVQLRLTEGGDSGSGKLKVFRALHSDWISKSLDQSSFPKQDELLGEQTVNVGEGDSVTIPLKSMLTGDGVYTLVVKLDEGSDDIWFGSGKSKNGPKLLITFEDPDGRYESFGRNSAKSGDGADAGDATVLSALTDFELAPADQFVLGYKDQARRALAINAAKYRDKFAAAESKYNGSAGIYDLVLTTLTETDGESSYRLLVSGKQIGAVQNPEAKRDYEPIKHRFSGVKLKAGDTIRVEFNSDSNSSIPEGDGFAYSRGRWQSVAIVKPNQTTSHSPQAAKEPAPAVVFETTYDPGNASKVHVQSGSSVVVEAEDYDAVDHQEHRQWMLTTADITPSIKPDPDGNHSKGAGGGAYLELLPDTRVTHSDPLVNGVSFAGQGGQCSVLYYPIEFAEPGRYYVWVRMCCTGSEDNGLHVGLDGEWPESGARIQFTGHHGQWQWDSRQRTEKVHTGVLGQIWLDIDKPGLHTVMFSMREDGFELDRFLLTKEKDAMTSKSLELGPATSPKRN
ncbi:DUF5060 domain-containing protein [Rubripirellula reticaptiva]|uniref:Beta-L-arabinobiosidase n=1 Tax=Rubripirellula reticaptiva TaxID=2528013 RepID=A0A5C6EPA0_9BACT|nr:DUF5060 domain-containing protein [Rubripirellula reticaptiva]TWU51583.1 Beta-L-arabinobiosidase precursor [Rubripirellula reticaptiva]